MITKPFIVAASAIVLMAAVHAVAQSPLPLMQPQGAAGPPVLITLQDAMNRAQKLDSPYLASVADAQVALEDRRQAKSAMLPQVSSTVQSLVTQGNGITPSGRFITNDGVHVYRAWGVIRQDLSPSTYLHTGYQRAEVAEAIAKTRVDVARLGLETTVNRNYYALVVAQRKYATAQQAVQQAQRFLDLTQQQERLGQVARADVVKADLQYQQQLQNYNDLNLAMENARLNLAVLLFPTLNENFTVVDDMDSAFALPPFPEVQALAQEQNPDLRVANLAVTEAGLDVKNARNAFLPSLSIDANYGTEANAFALHSTVAADREAGLLPNLGFFITGTINIPIWDWGGLNSKLKQARLRHNQTQAQLSQTQRQLIGNLYIAYNEALAAQSAVTTTRRAAELATESLRLTTLRYQAGESTALEVVDAQNAFVTVRNSYDDAQARARLAISTLRTLTGGF